MSRSIIVWGCVLLSLALGAARSLSWEYRHDEGTTVDVSIHAMTLGEYIPDWPAPPVSMTEITDRLEGRTGYTMGETVAALSTNFRTIHPPLYYLGVNLWTRAFGSGRLVMRLPALLLTALAVLGMALIARRVIPDRNAGLWAAALFALSPWVISLTNLARPYQLALFLAVWATVAALELAGSPEPSDRRRRRACWWAFGLCSLLGLYTVYHYVFVLAWHLCLLAVATLRVEPARRRGEWWAFGGCMLGIALGFAPWLPYLWHHVLMSSEGRNYFEGAVEASSAMGMALETLTDFGLSDSIEAPAGRRLLTAASALGLLTLPLMGWAFLGRPRRSLDGRARAFWWTAPVLPASVALCDLLLQTHTLFITKMCFAFIILLVLAVVRAWLAIPWAPLRFAGLAAWVLLLGATSVIGTTYTSKLVSPSESAAEVIAQDDAPSHLVVFSTDLRGYSIPFLLTMRDAGITNVTLTCARQADLRPLLEQVEAEGVYQRVSLVNHFIPLAVGGWMWEHLKVGQMLLGYFQARGWYVVQASAPRRDPRWVPPSPDDSDALTAWLFGPVRVRSIHGPR